MNAETNGQQGKNGRGRPKGLKQVQLGMRLTRTEVETIKRAVRRMKQLYPYARLTMAQVMREACLVGCKMVLGERPDHWPTGGDQQAA